MIVGFLLGLVVAYVLAFFHIDATIIAGVKELVKLDIGVNGYFLLMGLVGAISRMMIGGFVTGMFIAYAFTFINLDPLIIKGVKELFKIDIGMGGYYLLFAIIGAAVSLLKIVRTFLRPLFIFRKEK